ncbi:MAG: ABC transporter permease [Thermoanaerobaculia bacterium]
MSFHPQSSSDSPLVPTVRTHGTLLATRPLYWSIRRELWENRSIAIAPAAVAAVVLFASLINMLRLPARMTTLSALDPARQHAALVRPFGMAPAPIMMATFIVAFIYCLDALYGERRDRSILFWKSLPVSDRTTVLSKASVPFLILPLIAFALGVATLAIMLLLSTAILLVNGLSPARLWAELRLFQEPVTMLYGLTIHVLWFAPIYGWLLLVSAWARRMPVLWAGLPFFTIGIVEWLGFRTNHLATFLKYRFTGAMTLGFSRPQRGAFTFDLSQLELLRFLSTPGLWLGLLAAAACLAAAVRLRRDRGPI